MSTASIGLSAIARRKLSTSDWRYVDGFHMRGDWLKIWIARQPRSTPRSIAFASRPAGETWAPISMRADYEGSRLRQRGGFRATPTAASVARNGRAASTREARMREGVDGAMNPSKEATTRVRFAPSPTGALHIGGGRPAPIYRPRAPHREGAAALGAQ